MQHASGFEIVSLGELYKDIARPFSVSSQNEESISILRPRRAEGIPSPFVNYRHDDFQPVQNFEYSEVSVAFLPDAIVSQTGVVIVKDKYVIWETLEGTLEANFPAGFSRDSVLADCAQKDEVVISSSKLGMWNYSLFFLEVAPTFFLSSLVPSLHDFRHFIHFNEFMTKSDIDNRISVIETLGVDKSRLTQPSAPFCRYKGVVVFKINDPHRSQRLSQILSPVSAALKDIFVTNINTAPRRLYISRQSAASRKVSNFDALKAEVLDKYDVIPVVLEHLTVAEQVDLFSKAELVVAEHGAGLANAVFMPPGAFVLEFMPKSIGTRAVYRYLSHHSKLNYCCASIPVPPEWRWDHDDIVAPLNVYKFLLDRV